MELDELQTIWNSQNQQPMYMINEDALSTRIQSKKAQATHITNSSELLLIGVNGGAGCLILGLLNAKSGGFSLLYLMAIWMFITALLVLMSRLRRSRRTAEFDRSLLGELNHAIAITTYQIRLSQLMRWNMLPIVLFILISMLNADTSIWFVFALVAFFMVANLAGGWEHRFYVSRKHDLETLQKKLQQA